jgi:hypothetical protein
VTFKAHGTITTRRGVSFVAVLVLQSAVAAGVASTNLKNNASTYWTGGTGSWSQSANWRNGLSPVDTAIPADVFIDETLAVPSYVLMDSDSTVHLLFINMFDQLCILTGQTLTFGGVANNIILDNDGLVEIGLPGNADVSSPTAPSAISIWGNRTLVIQGDGELLMHNGRIDGADSNARIRVHQLIHGSGFIGNDKLSIDNQDRIVADDQSMPLVIQCNERGVMNSGTLEAVESALFILQTTINNHGGQLMAGLHGEIVLDQMTVNSGVLRTEANGRFTIAGSSSILQQTQLFGPLLIQSGDVRIVNSLVNNGRILFDTEGPTNSGQTPVRILLGSDTDSQHSVTFEGSGELRLDYMTLQRDPESDQMMLINGSDHQIVGGGTLGNGAIGLLNQGLIEASNPALTLTIQAAAGQPFVNEGIVRSQSPATLAITGSHFRNDGLVEVVDHGILAILPGVDFENLTSTTLNGGTWRVNGQSAEAQLFFPGITLLTNNATIELIGEHALFPAALTIAANYGALRILDDHQYSTQGFLTNAGELFIGLSSSVSVNGDYTQLTNGITKFRINAANPQYNPHLHVEGTASISGIIQLDVAANGLALYPGQEFTLIDADAIVVNPNLEIRGPGRYELVTDGTSLKIRVLAGCLADLNGNGAVDTDDFGAFFQWWGDCPAAPESCSADFNGDGIVGLQDFNYLLQSFGYCD